MRRDPAERPDAFGVADEVATDAEEDAGVEDEAEEGGEPFLRGVNETVVRSEFANMMWMGNLRRSILSMSAQRGMRRLSNT